MLKKTGFFVFIIVIAVGVGMSRNDPRDMDIRFTHLTLEDGLSQGSVSCMLHDQKGSCGSGPRTV